MSDALQPILALLDEGLSLYRRNFVGFLLIMASWFVPVAIAAGLTVVAISWAEPTWAVALALGASLLLLPLLIYLAGGLSRAAGAAAEGRPARFREAMAIRPLRAAGMGCFAVIYAIVSQIVSSFLSALCICPLYVVGVLAASLLGATTSSISAVPAILALLGVTALGFFASLTIVGATGSGLFYGLQPWVQEARPFGETLGRSLALIGYRFGRNLLVWCLAALLIAAVGLTVTATIGTLLPLPLAYALGEDSPVVQAIAIGAWLLGLMVILPPLPIWMALLYRRNRALYEGEELMAKVREWSQTQAMSDEF